MELELSQVFSARQLLNICIGVLVIALLGVSGEPAFDNADSDVNKSNMGSGELDNFWEYYFLSHLERALHRRITQLKENDERIELDSDDASYLQNGRDKRKVLGVAGLDNFDVMTKTLDRTRNRSPMMMSMPRMNTNRLRMLMEAQGRRK